MFIRVFNSNKNESYRFIVDETTTMKNIKDNYAKKSDIEVSKLKVWISSDILPMLKKKWEKEVDHLTLANCHILIPELYVFIIVKSI
jgi:hypothetical protein